MLLCQLTKHNTHSTGEVIKAGTPLNKSSIFAL
jgi:hypothetical protein